MNLKYIIASLEKMKNMLNYTTTCLLVISGCSIFSSPALNGTWSTVSSESFSVADSVINSGISANEINGKIYVFGGYDSSHRLLVQSFDPSNYLWSSPVTVGPPVMLTWFATNAIGNQIFLTGGQNYDSGTFNKVEVFDPTTNALNVPSTTGKLAGRTDFCSAVVSGKIYMIGGMDPNGNYDSTVDVYNPSISTWSTIPYPSIYSPGYGASCSVVNGKIYVMGGGAYPGGIAGDGSNLLEIFDPTTNSWSVPTTTGLLNRRTEFSSCVINGRIYVMGGYDIDGNPYKGEPTNVRSDMQMFDPSTNTWSTMSYGGSFTARYGFCSVVANGKIYVFGGVDANNNLVNTVQVFTPSP